jgi:hypothetical protein
LARGQLLSSKQADQIAEGEAMDRESGAACNRQGARQVVGSLEIGCQKQNLAAGGLRLQPLTGLSDPQFGAR